MKKLSLASLALFMNTLCALPIGNPSEASIFHYEDTESCICPFLNFGVGFYGDYVFNRHMQTDEGRDVDTTKLFTNAGYLVLNFNERVDLFTALGASRLSLNTSLVAFNSADPFPLFELESGSAFSYSIGGRATLFKYKCASLGIEGQYFSTKPDIKRAYIAAGAVSYLDDSLITHYTEWQLGGGISYRYTPFFIPYVAVKYSHSHWKLANGENIIVESNINTFFFNLRSQRNWGYAVGLTLCPHVCDKIAVTVEARFPDEKAFYVNGQMRF
jgi:Chlamydia major outer membrane protein